MVACVVAIVLVSKPTGRASVDDSLSGRPDDSNQQTSPRIAASDQVPIVREPVNDGAASGQPLPVPEGQPQQAANLEGLDSAFSLDDFQRKYGSLTLDELVGARASAERVYLKRVDDVLEAMLDRGEYEESILAPGGGKPAPMKSGTAYKARIAALPAGQTMVQAAKFDPSMHTETAAAYAEMLWLGQEINSRKALAGDQPR